MFIEKSDFTAYSQIILISVFQIFCKALFFYFLRRGLWETKEEYKGSKAIGPEDWERLFAMAHEQAVTGWLIDGVGRTAMRPARNVWEQWLFHLLYLEQMNRLAERCGQQWLERLEKAGMPAFVFKGTSVALWYQQPLHRSPGDVDIVLKEGWTRLQPVLAEAGIAFRDENGDIVVQENEQVPVEFHARWEYVYNPVVNARLQQLCRKADETDRELYLVCLILHIRRHFLTYGIGLKQVESRLRLAYPERHTWHHGVTDDGKVYLSSILIYSSKEQPI